MYVLCLYSSKHWRNFSNAVLLTMQISHRIRGNLREIVLNMNVNFLLAFISMKVKHYMTWTHSKLLNTIRTLSLLAAPYERVRRRGAAATDPYRKASDSFGCVRNFEIYIYFFLLPTALSAWRPGYQSPQASISLLLVCDST